jgi:proteasome accessory factor A
MCGQETEYALSVLGRERGPGDHGRAIEHLMQLARRTLPHLPDASGSGMFLQNGSRLYVDCGQHPELATCESVNPWDVCRYVMAGERMLAALAEQAAAEDRSPREIFLTRCNVCYSPQRATTWGCHESHLHQAIPNHLREQLVPHLVSRMIYTGAGGFDNQSAGIRFLVSPRVAHLEQVASDGSTASRGIYHNKDESLAASGYHRAHILCGESVCSQTALWLKTGVTSLVVAMVEAGLQPCTAIQLEDPLGAMRRFAADVELKATARSRDGRSWTALAMQRHILAQIEAHAGHRLMPAWTPQVIERLRLVLDRLEQGPAAVAKLLDWAIKLALYQQVADRRGIAWESLERWNQRLGRLAAETPAEPSQPAYGLLHLWLDRAAAAMSDPPPPAAPKENGRNGEKSRAVRELRQELFALDTRFGQLGPQGLFSALDQAGVLEHAVPGVDNIEHAMLNPPATGRARLRGECVRRFHQEHGRYSCDWASVWDHQQRRFLDLSHPFASEENWRSNPEQRPPSSRGVVEILQRMLADARRSYHQGRYEQAFRALEPIRPMQDCLTPEARLEALRLRAWVLCRRGFFDGINILDTLAHEHGECFWLATDYLLIYRFAGLAPKPEMARWIQTGRDILRRQPQQAPDWLLCFREHEGGYLLSQGRLEEARDVLQAACTAPREALCTTRGWCRAMAALGEVHRRLGNRAEAARALERAMSEQSENDHLGDRADFSWTYLAKLQAGSASAKHVLAQAKATQLEFQDRMGEARTLLLEARLSPDARSTPAAKQRILELKAQVPALGPCPLLAKVLDRWDAWTSGTLTADESGDLFWGV